MPKQAQTTRRFDWPLSGKMITSTDPLAIGDQNYKTLTNLRYTDKNPRGVSGMTAINASATSYTNIVNGFHFKKEQPAYDAVIVQTNDVGTSGAKLLKSSTSSNVPSADTFADFVTLAANTTCNFSPAPNGAMVACNGDQNYIYGGPESPVGLFVNTDPAGSFRYDYTTKVTNTLTDAQNVATMHSVAASVDSNTMLLLHLDNNVTDSAPTPNTVTNTGVTFSNTIYKFGSYSAVFNGTNAFLSVPDAAAFDFSGGTWTIDTWVYPTSLAAVNPIYYQNTTSDNDSFSLYIGTDGSLNLLIKAASTAVVTVSTPANAITASAWAHIEAVESGNNYYLFVNGTLLATGTDADRAANYTGAVQIGKNATVYFTGQMDEFRVSNAARNTSNFTPPLSAYGTTAQCYVALVYTRALQGAKFYVGTANTSASTVTAYVWNGTALSAVAGISDGTSVGGKTLAQTGTISFTSTVGTANLRYAEDTLGYYYLFVFSGIDAATTIYYCTVDAPMQSITDIWDGSERAASAFYTYTTSYNDYITNVSQKDYTSLSALTYVQLGSLTSAQAIYLACAERLTGVGFLLPDATYVNTAANVVMSVSYWTGSAWTSVGPITDATSVGNKSLNKSGVVSWSPPTSDKEFATTVANSDPWFFYKITFSTTLSADVRLDYIWGIPAPVNLRPSAFPVVWQDRLWLGNDVTGEKNQLMGSATQTNCVFNGIDAFTLTFGGDDAVMGAATLFSRFGSSLYDNMVVMKRSATYLVDWVITGTATLSSAAPGQYKIYTISQSVGCVAPLTIKACDMSFNVAQGVTKHVIMWQSDRGIEMFDGNALASISEDIEDFFDPTQANFINRSMVDQFYGFYDDVAYEYHWICSTGNSSTLNREMVYDLRRKKWFEIDRGTGKKLLCGFSAQDTRGNKYVYGGTADGHIERLEYGTAFDGNNIVHTLETGDIALSKSMMLESDVRYLKLAGVAKSITNATVGITIYRNTETAGITVPAQAMTSPGARLFGVVPDGGLRSLGANTALTHRFKFVVSTNNEIIGFEPLVISGEFATVREEVY